MGCLECKSSAERGKRFCDNCGNVLEVEEAVIRLDEDIVMADSDIGLSSNSRYKATSLLERRRLGRKQILVLAAVILCIISMGIILKVINKKEPIRGGNFVLMTKEEARQRALYLGVPGQEVVKLSPDADDNEYGFSYIISKDGSPRYIYFNLVGDLYEADSDGNTEMIAEGVYQEHVTTSMDLLNYVFITRLGKEMYLKEQGKEKVRIDSGVQDAFFMEDNKTLLYTKSNKEIFLWKGNGESVKVGEGVTYPYLVSASNIIMFINNDAKLIYKDLKSGEEKQLKQYNDLNPGTYLLDLPLIYDNKYILYKDGNSLFYLKLGEKEPVRVASDVGEYRRLEDMIFYSDSKQQWHWMKMGEDKSFALSGIKQPTNMYYKDGCLFYGETDGSLYRTKLSSDKVEKLQQHVSVMYPTENKLYFIVSNGMDALFEIDEIGNAVRIQDNIKKIYIVGKTDIAYLTNEGDLHIGGNIYEDVDQFVVAGKNICYIDKNNKMYIIKDKGTPELITENVKEYSKIYYGKHHLLEINHPLYQYSIYQQ